MGFHSWSYGPTPLAPVIGLLVGEEFQMSPWCGGLEEGDAARISYEWMGEKEQKGVVV